MRCTQDTKIPSLNCTPEFSLLRLNVTLSGVLDTTDLASVYGFTAGDVELKWISKSTTVSGDPINGDDVAICLVGGSVEDDDDTFISFYDDAVLKSGNRNWLGPLPCGYDYEPSTLMGIVNFSNTRSGRFGMPTFVPRASGSKQPDDPGTGDACKCSYFFKTKQVSVSASSAQIAVVNGFKESDPFAGVLNTVYYYRITKTLPAGKYYVYAVDGEIVMLKHTFQSDIIPVLLISIVTVTVVNGVVTVDIDQQIYPHTPCFVHVAELSDGATTLTYALSQPSEFELEASYSVKAICSLNNRFISTDGYVDIPINDSYGVMVLYAYLEAVTVAPDTEPTFGFAFSNNMPSPVERVFDVLRVYTDRHNFKIDHRGKPQLFTFTKIFINSDAEIDLQEL